MLTDVLGSPGSPAAYLLVAVDLLLSHWPKSREAAMPFLACPELLCLDGERHLHDKFEYPDIFGLKALQEPVGPPSVESLKKRDSRRLMLEQLLGQYDEPFFDVITQFLRSADAICFNGGGLQEPIAIGIRSALAT